MNWTDWWKKHAPFSWLNNHAEIHSFWVGFFEGLTFFIPHRVSPIKTMKMIDDEYWYYGAGRAFGFWLAIGYTFGIAKATTIVF